MYRRNKLISQKHIVIVIPNLAMGGAEKFVVTLANLWAEQGYRIEIVLMHREGTLLQAVSNKVQITSLECKRLRDLVFPLRSYLKKENPEVVWAHMWPLTSVVTLSKLLSGRPSRIYLTDHTNLIESRKYEMTVSFIVLKIILKLTYIFATKFTAVSKGVASSIREITGPIYPHAEVIYNPAARGVDPRLTRDIDTSDLWGDEKTVRLLTVGRLKRQKNHALLLSAIAKVSQHCRCKLAILGDGELMASLRYLATSLGISDCIIFKGFVDDPSLWYATADVFVLASDWEGFGNVIVEAMEYGLPVVSTDCPSGPAEILAGGKYGTLVPVGDVDSLAAGILQALDSSIDRETVKSRAKEYSLQKVSEQYLRLFRLRS